MSYPQDIIIEGGGFARIVPISAAGSQIDSFDGAEKIDLEVISDEAVEFANYTDTKEYYSRATTTGVNVRLVKRSKTIDAVTGNEVSSSHQPDKIILKAVLSYSDKKKIVALMRGSSPVAIAIAGGRVTDRSVPGYCHLIGRITGNLREDIREEINETELQIVGGEGFTLAAGIDYLDYNTAMTSTAVTPLGRSAVNISGIASSDETDILSGRIVVTDAV